MSQHHSWTYRLAAAFITGAISVASIAAHADVISNAARSDLTGNYRSVTNGITNYDGFDRFRDSNGQPLPGWEQELSSPG